MRTFMPASQLSEVYLVPDNCNDALLSLMRPCQKYGDERTQASSLDIRENSALSSKGELKLIQKWGREERRKENKIKLVASKPRPSCSIFLFAFEGFHQHWKETKSTVIDSWFIQSLSLLSPQSRLSFPTLFVVASAGETTSFATRTKPISFTLCADRTLALAFNESVIRQHYCLTA